MNFLYYYQKSQAVTDDETLKRELRSLNNINNHNKNFYLFLINYINLIWFLTPEYMLISFQSNAGNPFFPKNPLREMLKIRKLHLQGTF